jgi:two-component system chemotaxis sensor kinase CheA
MIRQLKDSLDATFDSAELIDQISAALEGRLEIVDLTAPTDYPLDASHFDDSQIFSPEMVNSKNAAETHSLEAPSNNVLPLSQPLTKNSSTANAQSDAQPNGQPKVETPKSSSSNPAATDESIRVSLARLEKLLNYVGEMVILQAVLKEQTQSSGDLFRKTVHQLGKVTKEVQDISMSLRMVPLKGTFQKMQRIVRDISLELGKKVTLSVNGEDTELDKTILERVNDPLVHLVRNACDHGIENAELRLTRQKPETGTIRLSASHQSGRLVIEVSDDGGGINPNVLRQKAIEKKILPPGKEISDQEAINLIFHPGFSTKAVVTDVSGRGVGMDVVKHNIESLQGDVMVETKLNHGTKFKIILPLTLAIIDAMVVTIGDSRFVVPLSHIHETVKLDPHDVKITTGLGEILLLRGETIPLFRLHNLLGRKAHASAPSQKIGLVIEGSNERFAILVDDIIGQYQVVIKQLGSELQNIRGFSGSSILGDGKPALILELADLVAKAKAPAVLNFKGAVA